MSRMEKHRPPIASHQSHRAKHELVAIPETSGTSTIVAIVLAVTIVIVPTAATFWLARRSLSKAKPVPNVETGSHAPDTSSHPSQCGASTGLDIRSLRPRSWKNNQVLIFAVQRWADERVQRIPCAEVRAMLAFEDFCKWCHGQGLRPCAVAAFGRAFTLVADSWGCRKVKKRSAAYYQACRLTGTPMPCWMRIGSASGVWSFTVWACCWPC
jgi:hypothetical protein